jgi:hypothetical protein
MSDLQGQSVVIFYMDVRVTCIVMSVAGDLAALLGWRIFKLLVITNCSDVTYSDAESQSPESTPSWEGLMRRGTSLVCRREVR